MFARHSRVGRCFLCGNSASHSRELGRDKDRGPLNRTSLWEIHVSVARASASRQQLILLAAPRHDLPLEVSLSVNDTAPFVELLELKFFSVLHSSHSPAPCIQFVSRSQQVSDTCQLQPLVAMHVPPLSHPSQRRHPPRLQQELPSKLSASL